MALTPSPDGMHLYVADAAHRVLADLDTQRLVLDRVGPVRIGGNVTDAVSITATPGFVFIARGSTVTPVSTTTMRSRRPWHVSGNVAGIQTEVGGDNLYVATRNRVVEVDPGRTAHGPHDGDAGEPRASATSATRCPTPASRTISAPVDAGPAGAAPQSGTVTAHARAGA